MARSLLAAVRGAVFAGAAEHADDEEMILDDGETGAAAPLNQEDTRMSTNDTPAGGDKKTGISQAEHEAAVKTARSEGEATGAKAATDRFATALGADGVKGNAARMAAAVDLAVKSTMSGEDIAAYVTANVGGEPAADAAAYEAERTAAAGAAQPVPKADPKAGREALSGAVARTNKRR